MNFKQALAEIAHELDELLISELQAERDRRAQVSPYTQELMDFLIPICSGGKRIRGALAYYAYQLCGGKDFDAIKRVALSLELTHAYLLIHDDIMDNDPLRRGKQTLHTGYADWYKGKFEGKEPEHFGASMAICGGDILSHLAQLVFMEANFPADKLVMAMRVANQQFVSVGFGQVLDVLAESRTDVDEEDVLTIHHLKTGVYTFEAPLLVGAILAGASPEELAQVSQFAIPAGMTYQIQDDILGVFADEEKLGKPVGSDIREGKATLLILKALLEANPREKKFLLSKLGRGEISDKDLERVRAIIVETGSLDHSRKLAQDYVLKAKAALAGRKWQGEDAYEFLVGLADYMLAREF
jgi:geranylgeranyl diphosphate synthase type I